MRREKEREQADISLSNSHKMQLFMLLLVLLHFLTTAQSCARKSVPARVVEECAHGCSGGKKAELAAQGLWDTLTLQMDWGWVDDIIKEEDERKRKIQIVLREERERKALGRGDERIIPNTTLAEDRIQRYWILDRAEKGKKEGK